MKLYAIYIYIALAIAGCPAPAPHPTPDASPSAPGSFAPVRSGVVVPGPAATSASAATVANDTNEPVAVYLAFGSNSVALPSSNGWGFCTASAKLNCSFQLAAKSTQVLPLNGQYLNATISFVGPVTCNVTKAELNLNNPTWYDVTDISLVDGFNKIIAVDVKDANGFRTLGPVLAKDNEKAFGVYPLGCDICVARQSPPCGFSKGKDGCKGGTQYAPDVPCQYQGPTMSGGSVVTVRLLAGVPLK